jgi:hypothetical protein
MTKQLRFMRLLTLAASVLFLEGCAALAAPPVIALSITSTVIGGVANGALMGGSTVGVIRNAAVGARNSNEPQLQLASNRPPAPLASAKVSAIPTFASGLERACYFPNARARDLPCS